MKRADNGFAITSLVPNGPAQKAGLRVGDVLKSLDGQSLQGLDFDKILVLLAQKTPGTSFQVTYSRSNADQPTLTIPVAPRSSLYPAETKLPPSVGQYWGDGDAAIAALCQTPSQPQSVQLWLYVADSDGPPLALDDSKFFILDGQGQQLHRMTLEEINYSLQLWLAQNWRGGNYPPPTPPPPQPPRYTITGSETGNYTITSFGTVATVSGTTSSTYVVQQQPDYAQAGYMLGYTIGVAVRKLADKRHNDKLLQQVKQAYSYWDSNYFKTQTPVIPGENRTGGILFWSGSARAVAPPFTIVMFVPDPRTGKDQTIKFQFR